MNRAEWGSCYRIKGDGVLVMDTKLLKGNKRVKATLESLRKVSIPKVVSV